MAKRASQEINAGSMADIAFLLLIFFLVATTMNVDSGIMRTLPAMADEESEDLKALKRNLMSVSLNQADQILLNYSDYIPLSRIVGEVKKFILNETNSPDLPEFEEVEINLIGKVKVSKGVISLQNLRETTYDMYVKVQNELTRAINELRDEASMRYFGGRTFENLSEEEQEAIRDVIPMRISEAEPYDATK